MASGWVDLWIHVRMDEEMEKLVGNEDGWERR